MATTATAPERKVSAAEAREVAEAAREQEWVAPSFVRDLFLGKFRLDLIHPYPEQDPEEVRRAQPFLEKLERLLREQVDSDRIDREGEIPESVIQGLRDLGAFGIKIPREYGGLGLSQLSYMKAIELVSSIDGSLTALLSAHQSIGVHQRHQGGAAGRDRAHAVQGREGQGKAADHGVHRRDRLAGREGRAPLPLHGPEGDL